MCIRDSKYPHEISAGEAQRASLARSLMTRPDLLLLDEPLSNVDQSFKEEIQVRLKKILYKLKISTIIVQPLVSHQDMEWKRLNFNN